ncbi:MAG TPA: hypothetical protein VGK73_40420 [Polyangiaceae bacterium]
MTATRPTEFPRKALLLTSLCVALGGCPSRESLGTSGMSVLGAGVVNDPANKSLRFDILKFGLDSFCAEMLKGGAPLKLADEQPVVGRFFAASCQTQLLDEEQRKSFIVQYRGKGYAFGIPLGRIGFEAAGLVEYAPDFQVHDGALYVYFRPRLVDTSSFKTLLVEVPGAQSAMAAAGVNAETLGKRIVDGQLRRGFTVIRRGSHGETEFGMGIIPTGEHPFHPYEVKTEDKRVLFNDRTEVHTQQQDFVGAFAVEDDGQALYLNLSVDGAPAVDVLLLTQAKADPEVDAYVREAGPRTLAGPVLFDEPLQNGQPFRRYVPVPPGRYYLVLDHSDRAGRGPAPDLRADRAAKIDYLLMVGDAP